MKKLLFVDCCIRKESRTKELAQSFLQHVSSDYEIIHLELSKMSLHALINEHFEERQHYLELGQLDHPRFNLAHQIAQVDEVLIAAPFWDLSFPSLLKVYIENCCVDGITFKSTADGIKGLCQANNIIYLTTRGGFYTDSIMEQALPYIKHIGQFFGINQFHYVAADGMDIVGFDSKASLENAKSEAILLAKTLFEKQS